MGLGLWPQAFSVRQAGDRLWSQQLLFGVAGIVLELEWVPTHRCLTGQAESFV